MISVEFVVDHFLDLVPSHNSFSFASYACLCVQSLDISEQKLDFESQNLIIWSCTLEHTLANPIVL